MSTPSSASSSASSSRSSSGPSVGRRPRSSASTFVAPPPPPPMFRAPMTHAGRTTQRTADTTTTTHKLMYVAAAVVAILGLVYLPKWMHSTYQYALGQATGESASDTPIAGGEGPRPPDKLNSLARSLTDAALQQYAAAQQPQLRRTQRLVHVTTALANVRAARKLVDTFATSEQMQASVGYDLDEFAVLLEHALQHTLQQQQQQQPSRTP